MLIDSHCHLDFPALCEDLDAVVARASGAGIAGMVTICTKVSEFEQVAAIADAHRNIYCTVGLHPHEAAQEPDVTVVDLLARAEHPKCVAIGETGLDFYYEHSPRAIQATQFREHIAAARQSGLPLIVHTRDADLETGDILADEMGQGAYSGLIHCFSAGWQLAKRALDLGLYISISGIVTFKNADAIRDVVAKVPLDRLLVETDSPYLAPVPKRGKRNEPAFVVHTAEKVAEIKGIPRAELDQITARNFFHLFSKADRAAFGDA